MMMRASVALAIVACLAAGNVHAADKADVLSRIDAARMAVEAFVAKNKNNETVVADVEAARGYIRKAAAAFESGKQMFGFGGIKQEAEQEIAHCLAMSDLNVALAESRLAKKRNDDELASITGQRNKVKVKVQRFEDRKAEMERLRAEAAKSDALAKELSQLKADKALLVSQVEMLMAERKELETLRAEKGEMSRKLAALAADNAKRAGDAGAKHEAVPETMPATAKPVPEPAQIQPAVVKLPLLQENEPVPAGKGEAPLSELIVPEKNDAPETPKLEPLIPGDPSAQ